ncbi:MAG: VWA domain-containing protein [Bryobacteraceae bacterium]
MQQIATLSTEDAPVSAVIVFDASGSMKRSIPIAGLALREFLDTANPADEFSVVTVRARPEIALPFVSRPEDVLDCMRGIKGAGRTALLDSVYIAAAYVRKGRHPRKVVLVISDGEDNHSRHTERELLNVLRETDVTLYSIGVDIQTPQYSPDGARSTHWRRHSHRTRRSHRWQVLRSLVSKRPAWHHEEDRHPPAVRARLFASAAECRRQVSPG